MEKIKTLPDFRKMIEGIFKNKRLENLYVTACEACYKDYAIPEKQLNAELLEGLKAVKRWVDISREENNIPYPEELVNNLITKAEQSNLV